MDDKTVSEMVGVRFRPSLIDAAIDSFNRLYPGTSVNVGYIPAEQCVGDDGTPAQAFTLFPDDGTPPEIWISDETPILGVPDTLFHELAHVVAGIEADHGPEFDAVYSALWVDMDRSCSCDAALGDTNAA